MSEKKPISLGARKAAADLRKGLDTTPPPPAPAPATRHDPGDVLAAQTVARLDRVAANPFNPRTDLAEQAAAAAEALAADHDPHDMDPDDPARPMAELIVSMRARGQMQSVVVMLAKKFRRLFEGTPEVAALPEEIDFVIIGGGRRQAATPYVPGMTELKITCLHSGKEPQTRAEFLAVSVAENVQREQLSLPQTLTAVRQLLDAPMSGVEVARLLGKTSAWVSQYKSISELPDDVRAVVDGAPFNANQAYRLTQIGDRAEQLYEARRVRAELLGHSAPAAPALPRAVEPQLPDIGGDQAAADVQVDEQASRTAPAPPPAPAAPARRGPKPKPASGKIRDVVKTQSRDDVVVGLAEAFPDADPARIRAALVADPEKIGMTRGHRTALAYAGQPVAEVIENYEEAGFTAAQFAELGAAMIERSKR